MAMHKRSSGSALGPGGLDLTQALFKSIMNAAPSSPTKDHNKISVVGAGNVGMAIAQTISLRISPTTMRFLTNTTVRCWTSSTPRPSSPAISTLFEKIIPPLVRYSPDTILLIVSNPVDVLTYVAWKLSGFPSNHVIGYGTNLDSSRFRFLIADHLDVNAQDVQWGNMVTAQWSSISVGGVPVLSFFGEATNCGFYGIDGGEVFLSLPAQLGRGGVLGITNVHLTEEETQRLRDSAKTILRVQNQLVI
ncbi:hypothetical protein JHK85_030562 [Glycine max]|uniref:L-lactate dehydrogenase A n=1 Tax=Glycine soja TaxID=3848 RepID=A0A445HWQ1_GLYSO|nr:hypothetical protein JHK85_030562 [Glycine max]KAG4993200.1 hypothetical protein JHK86_030027 [Glycine max]RZB78082.1 L-lactate dehydrogenase A [Glycine soja]